MSVFFVLQTSAFPAVLLMICRSRKLAVGVAAHLTGHTKKRPESVLRRTATNLSRTIAGHENNAGTTAHAGTSVPVVALGRQL